TASIGSWRARKWRTGQSSLPSSRGALTEAARVLVTGCCRSLRQIVVGRFEATRNDSELFSLDKTIEAQFVEQCLDHRCLPCSGKQEAEPVGAACFLRAPRAATPPRRREA